MGITFQVEERHSARYQINREHFTDQQWLAITKMNSDDERAAYLRSSGLLAHAEYIDNTAEMNERDDSTISSVSTSE